jgi:membrane protein DedA with SNARE-associated domain
VSALHALLSDSGPYLREYGYPLVFGLIFLESFGLPVPGESVLITAALLAGRHEMDLTLVIAIAGCAAVLGDNVGYAIGRYGGRRLLLRYGSFIGATGDRLHAVETFFRRYGGGIVIVARFIALARQLNGIVAGTASMPWWRFLAFNALGALLWVGFWGFGGGYIGRHAAGLLGWAHHHGYLAAAAGAGVLMIVLGLYRFLHKLYSSGRSFHSRDG